MATSLDFFMGFTCFGLLGSLALLYQMIQILKELLILLKVEISDE